jgi:hypothetical protein
MLPRAPRTAGSVGFRARQVSHVFGDEPNLLLVGPDQVADQQIVRSVDSRLGGLKFEPKPLRGP